MYKKEVTNLILQPRWIVKMKLRSSKLSSMHQLMKVTGEFLSSLSMKDIPWVFTPWVNLENGQMIKFKENNAADRVANPDSTTLIVFYLFFIFSVSRFCKTTFNYRSCRILPIGLIWRLFYWHINFRNLFNAKPSYGFNTTKTVLLWE